MASIGWFRKLFVAGNAQLSSQLNVTGAIATSSGLTVAQGATISSGITRGLTTGPTTGVDLVVGSIHTLISSSDGGYYKIDPPTAAGQGLEFVRAGTTASTSYLIPDDTGVSTSMVIYTSSGSSDGRLITMSGSATVSLRSLTTAIWLVAGSRGNVAVSSST